MSSRAKPGGSRREQVVSTLRQALVLGEYADGERLVEGRIARELHTSRGPVREALRELEHEGLVVSYPYRGAVALGVSDEEVQGVLIPVRLTLERFAFAKALPQVGEAELAELAKEVWVMEDAARDTNLVRCVEADMRFHEFVLALSGQRHTLHVWRAIAPRIRAYLFRYGRAADLAQIAAEHSELLDALRSHDRRIVAGALETHILVPTPVASRELIGPARA